MKASVVEVGDANVDLIAPVEFLPGEGEEVSTGKLHKCAGGSAANLCVALAMLGHDSRFIGRVGDEPLGRFLIDNFRKEKVDISQLQIDEKVLKVARGAGALVSLDVGVLPATRATNRVCSILRYVDILFLGELEASALVGTKKPEKAAKDLLKFGPKIVAL